MKHLQSDLRKISSIIVMIILVLFASCSSDAQNKEEAAVPTITIHEAVFWGNEDQVKAHIAANTDLNEKDAYGSAPITIAITFGKTEVARLLIDAGVDINIKSGDGSTPLHSAAFFCRTEIVEMLLAKGADTSIRSNYGSTALESIQAPFESVKPIYDQISKDLGPLGLKLNYDFIEKERPVIAELISKANNK